MSDDGGDDGESKKVRESSRGEKRGKKTTHFALVSSITSPSSQARSTGTVRLEEGEESAVASAAAAAGGGAKKRTAGGEKVEAETTAVTAKARLFPLPLPPSVPLKVVGTARVPV